MRSLFVAAAFASTALAAPAFAAVQGPYVGLEAGAVTVQNIKYKIGGSQALNVDTKPGAAAMGVLGYDFGGFKVEGEISWKRVRIDSARVTSPALGIGQGNYDAAGKFTSKSAMLNALYVVNRNGSVRGELGAGAGIARVKAHNFRLSNGAFIDGSRTGFAWQLIAGASASVTSRLDVTLRYRYFNVENLKFLGSKSDIRAHTLTGGLVYNLGQEAAPPPAPAASPAASA